MLQVTGSRSKVGHGSDSDVAQLDKCRNIYAKFEFLLVYGHRDLARTMWLLSPTQLIAQPDNRVKSIPA